MTDSLITGNELMSVLFGMGRAESITTLPFVICSFIFFSNAVFAMLAVAVTDCVTVSFAVSPLPKWTRFY